MAETNLVPQVESHERPTIMDGRVVTYSTAFREEDGVFGTQHVATGPFEISASRNCVVIHRADIRRAEDLQALKTALDLAYQEFEGLRGHRGW